MAAHTAQRWHGGLVVMTAAEVPPALAHARQAQDAARGERQLPFDLRPFKPHVTLARRVPRSVALPAPPAPLLWRGAGHVLAVREGAGYRILAPAAVSAGLASADHGRARSGRA